MRFHLSAVIATAITLALPVAATAAPAPVIVKAAAPSEAIAQPYVIRIGTTECPAMPADTALSERAQRLYAALTQACLLKASGMIREDQFTQMRDLAVDGLTNELMTTAFEPPSAVALNH